MDSILLPVHSLIFGCLQTNQQCAHILPVVKWLFLPPLLLYFSKEWYVLNITLPAPPLADVKVLIRWKMACVNAMQVSWSKSSIVKHGNYIHINHQYAPTQHTLKIFCISYTLIYLLTSQVQYILILYSTASIILSNLKTFYICPKHAVSFDVWIPIRINDYCFMPNSFPTGITMADAYLKSLGCIQFSQILLL